MSTPSLAIPCFQVELIIFDNVFLSPAQLQKWALHTVEYACLRARTFFESAGMRVFCGSFMLQVLLVTLTFNCWTWELNSYKIFVHNKISVVSTCSELCMMLQFCGLNKIKNLSSKLKTPEKSFSPTGYAGPGFGF